MSYAQQHLNEAIEIINKIDIAAIEKMADLLASVKVEGGRVFFLGVGGSAGNSSHAVNDFRKIVGIESYAPTDNVSELTARTNDEGWASVFVEWLKISKLASKDALFILSVGGGNLEKNISPNLVEEELVISGSDLNWIRSSSSTASRGQLCGLRAASRGDDALRDSAKSIRSLSRTVGRSLC